MSTKIIPYSNIKPKEVSDEMWEIVVEAWENGLSDREAAYLVSKKTGEFTPTTEITSWRKKYPKVDELKAFLEVSLRTEAKLTVKDAIRGGKVKSAQWYLERKAADEFSTKSAVAFEGAVIDLSLDEKEQALKDLVETFKHGE